MLVYLCGDVLRASGSIAHCISADAHMGRGVARQIRDTFGHVGQILLQNPSVGDAVPVYIGDGFVYHLVTKNKYFHRPSLDSVAASLINMREHMLYHGVYAISMPRIASGLDRLNWVGVEQLLKNIFYQTGITVYVYTL